MRILLVTPAYYPSSFGGVKNSVTTLSRELVKLGHEVSVYTSNAYNFRKNMEFEGEHVVEGVRVIYFKNYFPKRYWHTPRVVWQIMKERKRFDIVHLNNNFSYMNCIVYWMLKAYKIPIVFSAHGSLRARFRNRFIKGIYNRIITRNILKYASKLIAVNEEEMDQYLKMRASREKIEIIPIGINLRNFAPVQRSDKFRKKYNISKSEKIILFVGRIHFIKGIEYVIEAVGKLINSGYLVKFLVIGPDFGYLEKLKKAVSRLNLGNQVLFIGALYGKEKVEAFYNSDIFILPSVSDSFGIVALEAGYCGLPLVLSNGVSLSKEIKNNAALLVSLNVNDIYNALEKLIKNNSLRLRLGQKAKKIIKEKYNSTLIAKKTLNIYEAIVKNE